MNDPTNKYCQTVLNVDSKSIERLKMLRNYAEGEQRPMITRAQSELLGEKYNEEFSPQINLCDQIIEVKTDRLEVLGQQVQFPPDVQASEEIITALNNALDSVWKLSDMGVSSEAMHYGSLRDGDGYIIVDWSAEYDQPSYHYNEEFDGEEGVHMEYGEPTNRRSALYAFKVWETLDLALGMRTKVKRLNIYWRDRIEYFVQSGMNKQWVPLRLLKADGSDLTEAMSMPDPFNPGQFYNAEVDWLTEDETATGIPLGMPVFHYPHKSRGMATGVSELRNIAPGLQDDINASHVNVIMAGELAGTPVYYATKFKQPQTAPLQSDSAKRVVEIYPGAFIYSTEDGSFGSLPPADLSQLVGVLDSNIKKAAMISSTPMTFVNVSGQMPAEGSLLMIENQLVAKVMSIQEGLGAVYGNAARYALTWIQIYAQRKTFNLPFEILKRLEIKTVWKPAQSQAMKITLEEALQKKQLGVPDWQLQAEMGYKEDEIKKFAEDSAKRRNEALAAVNLAAQAQVREAEAGANLANGNPPKPEPSTPPVKNQEKTPEETNA